MEWLVLSRDAARARLRSHPRGPDARTAVRGERRPVVAIAPDLPILAVATERGWTVNGVPIRAHEQLPSWLAELTKVSCAPAAGQPPIAYADNRWIAGQSLDVIPDGVYVSAAWLAAHRRHRHLFAEPATRGYHYASASKIRRFTPPKAIRPYVLENPRAARLIRLHATSTTHRKMLLEYQRLRRGLLHVVSRLPSFVDKQIAIQAGVTAAIVSLARRAPEARRLDAIDYDRVVKFAGDAAGRDLSGATIIAAVKPLDLTGEPPADEIATVLWAALGTLAKILGARENEATALARVLGEGIRALDENKAEVAAMMHIAPASFSDWSIHTPQPKDRETVDRLYAAFGRR